MIFLSLKLTLQADDCSHFYEVACVHLFTRHVSAASFWWNSPGASLLITCRWRGSFTLCRKRRISIRRTWIHRMIWLAVPQYSHKSFKKPITTLRGQSPNAFCSLVWHGLRCWRILFEILIPMTTRVFLILVSGFLPGKNFTFLPVWTSTPHAAVDEALDQVCGCCENAQANRHVA